MEGLALTGASVDRERGLLSTIVLEMGGSSDLCALLKPGEPVILMGPTGTPTETPANETALLVGGGLGNAVLFSIGQACARAVRVSCTSPDTRRSSTATRSTRSRAAADVVVWCCDEAPGFTPDRAAGSRVRRQHRSGDGGLRVAANWATSEIPLNTVDRVIAIGSDGMMNAVARARHGVCSRT